MWDLKWCPKTDLNRRPTIYETVALPTELLGHLNKKAGEQTQPSFVWKKYECWFPVGGQDAHS